MGKGSSSTDSNNSSNNNVGIGQTLKTDYFEVTVSKAETTPKIKATDEYSSDKLAGEGNKYLVMTTTFKNIDKETRTLIDGGKVFINYNGKDYKFDTPESILEEGYGVFLDPINPLISKTTKIVFKLPADIKGPAYYSPSRADDDERIFLGNLD